jgi:heme oxygenase
MGVQTDKTWLQHTNCPVLCEACKQVIDLVEDCPAFKDAGPFSQAESLDDWQRAISSIPRSHLFSSEIWTVLKTLVEVLLIEAKGKLFTCPGVGKLWISRGIAYGMDGTPRNTLLVDGSPLVDAIEPFVSTWGVDDLAARLKQGTLRTHRAAENVVFVRDFMAGQISKELYTLMLVNLTHIYEALEESWDACAARLPTLTYAELRRTEALRADVAAFSGMPADQALAEILPTPAVLEYVARLRELRTMPDLLVAHAYTRYLGDLSGGQVLAKAVRSTFGEDSSVEFYEFPIESAHNFKQQYRRNMDALRPSAEVAEHIVEEANVAFLYNMMMFQDLDVKRGVLAKAHTMPELQALTNLSALGFQKAYQKCPFLAKPAPVDSLDSSVEEPGEAECIWPFILLHQPVTGAKQHPYKSAVLAAAGLYFGWRRLTKG